MSFFVTLSRKRSSPTYFFNYAIINMGQNYKSLPYLTDLIAMKTNFKVVPDFVKTINVLPDAWSSNDYKELLDIMDYGNTSDLSEDELMEMTLISLSDNAPNVAAEIVLKHVFKDALNKGQVQNLSHEIQEENTWETYADLSMHENFFNTVQLLYKAYNGKFPHPDAMYFRVSFEVKSKVMLDIFNEETEKHIIRILAQGMPPHTLLKRLYKEELEDGAFKNASDIIWQLKKVKETETSITFDVVSSNRWFEDIKYVEPYEAQLVYEED
ncbi:hypothetical protein [Dokdonia sp. Hel_I_53]|uniref:hypothetical protein n=1 Tax=Dokdonia sp. Hel_I_53 TaxID=1566287 RepID=UPI001199FF05|nr:hypothetical protein [Dokdonia sp. Hel_I_53]TVZ53130.1 hypothetical protein OD90_2326 [Dokdonia sp. Hel_I_53]